MHILIAFSGLLGLRKKNDMKLRENNGGKDGQESGVEGNGGGPDQNTLYARTKFSNNKQTKCSSKTSRLGS